MKKLPRHAVWFMTTREPCWSGSCVANHGLSMGLKELEDLEEAIRKAESELLEPERAQDWMPYHPQSQR
jgi:hypothetical protein